MDIRPILDEILAGYSLPWFGTHGLSHWGRVLENGLRVAESTGADRTVVTLFALFHDACRENESVDPGHGRRGAELARAYRGSFFEVSDAQFRLLHEACALHTDGLTEGDVTVQTCWDADRLDLARVGIRPHRALLCTKAARDPAVIEWATGRAISEEVPDAVQDLWESLHSSL